MQIKQALLTAIFLAVAAKAAAQTLVFCPEGGPEGFDPALHTSANTFNASSRQIYDRLVEFAPGATTLEPGLAESWTVSDDGLEYTFVLRSGVAFHTNDLFTPTRDLTADDVVFSFERQRLPDHPYHRMSAGGWSYFEAMSMPDLIRSVQKVDERTVTFVLSRPDSSFPANLAMDFASILSAEYADAMMATGTPDRLDTAPIGTGPFQFVAFEDGTRVRYRANADYWNGAPEVAELVFDVTPEASERSSKLLSGACHIAPAPGDRAALEDSAEAVVVRSAGLDVGYLAYNTTVPPYDKAEVRRALNMAIDKRAIIETVFDGDGQIAKNPIPPTNWGYSEDTQDDIYDPARARRMLDEAGVEDLTLTLWAMPIRRPYNPDSRRMAELIRGDMADIGVEVEIVSHDWPEFLRLSRAPDRQGAVLFGWMGSNGDPDNFLRPLLGCEAVGRSNRAQWCHEPFEALVSEARTTRDPSERARLYLEAQAIFKEQAPWATLAHSVTSTALRAEVEGFVADPFGRFLFKSVSLAD